MNLKIDEHLSLGYFTPADIHPIAEYLNDMEVYNNTLRIPHPYTLKHSEDWVAANMEKQQEDTVIENYTIRLDDQLIGGIGFVPLKGPQAHSAEIGYWLGSPYRNKGIMTRVIGFFCDQVFKHHHFTKLIAHTYADNTASHIALQKNGFMEEGFLKHHYKKGDRYIDSRVFGRIK